MPWIVRMYCGWREFGSILPQPRDMHADGACRGHRVIAPDLVQQLVARQRGTAVHTGINFNARDRRTLLFANYSWMRHENDSDGPFALPADRFNPAAEWERRRACRGTNSVDCSPRRSRSVCALASPRRDAPALRTTSPPGATTTVIRSSTIVPRALAVTARVIGAHGTRPCASATRLVSANERRQAARAGQMSSFAAWVET